MTSLGLSARRFLRRAPLPNWLRVWLRPMGRRVPASLIRYILHAQASKRLVSRVTPCELPRLDGDLLPFALPAPRDATISIIVPFHRQPELTLRCLWGLSRHASAHAFEVIAVDDGSDAASRAAVARVEGLRIV